MGSEFADSSRVDLRLVIASRERRGATFVNGKRHVGGGRILATGPDADPEFSVKPLKVGLLGLAGTGEEYLSALEADERLDLVAVAETDPDLLRRHTESESLRGYEDHRSLVVEGGRAGLGLLFVALEPFESIDFVELAARHGISVFHKAPPARTVAELQRLVKVFSEAQCSLIVSRPWKTEPAFAGLSDLSGLAGHVHAATAEVHIRADAAGWRGDSIRAGGGVLLNGAYEQLDILVALLGLPESVYAQCSMAVAPGGARKHDTEDSITVALRFAGERIAALSACRGAAEDLSRVILVGTNQTVEVYSDRMTLTPAGGGTEESRKVLSGHSAAAAIRAIADSLAADAQPLESTGQEHLATMAVIEAAYLSAKTGAPERPARFLT